MERPAPERPPARCNPASLYEVTLRHQVSGESASFVPRSGRDASRRLAVVFRYFVTAGGR
jgi:hypothetical protein